MIWSQSPRAELTPSSARRASRRREEPAASQPDPKSSRKLTKRPWCGQHVDVGGCSVSGDGENSATPSSGRGPGGESFYFCSALGPAVPTFSKKEQFPFPPGSQVHGTTVCDALLPHSRPTAHLASKQESAVRVRSTSPSTSGRSCPGLQGFLRTRYLLYHPAILPFAAPSQVRQLCRWSRLHGIWRRGSCCPAHLAGSRAQFDSATRFSSPVDLPSSTAFSRLRWQSETREEISVFLAKDKIEPVPPAKMRQGFYRPYFIVPKKSGGLQTNPGSGSLEPGFAQAPLSNASSPRIGLQRSTWRMLTFMFRSFRDTDRSYGLHLRVGHGSTGSSPSGSPCVPVSLRRS